MFPQYYRSKTFKGYLNKGPRWDYNTNDMKNNYTVYNDARKDVSFALPLFYDTWHHHNSNTYATSTISLVWLARKSTTNHRRDIRTAPSSFFFIFNFIFIFLFFLFVSLFSFFRIELLSLYFIGFFIYGGYFLDGLNVVFLFFHFKLFFFLLFFYLRACKDIGDGWFQTFNGL